MQKLLLLLRHASKCPTDALNGRQEVNAECIAIVAQWRSFGSTFLIATTMGQQTMASPAATPIVIEAVMHFGTSRTVPTALFALYVLSFLSPKCQIR